ncbi:YdbH domain-containing protein, partial [Salmonella enterica]
WLRYMEITHSWTKINVDNLGVLTMQAAITGKSRVDGKTAIVNLNYTHEENVFTLWRSLRFGDNLQAWLEQNTALPQPPCRKDKDCEDK